jgi:hypothetical protein
MLHFQSPGKPFLFILLMIALSPLARSQQVLDSIVTYRYENGDSIRSIKIGNEFNGNGKLSAHTIYQWNNQRRIWEGSSFPCEECYPTNGRIEYDYNGHGDCEESRSFGWGGLSVGWVINARGQSKYDLNGNKVYHQTDFWNSSGHEWEPVMGEEFGYDESGRKTLWLVYQWISGSNSWLPFDHYEWEYDQKGRELSEFRFKWTDSIRDWSYITKKEWTYDSSGLLTEVSKFQRALSNDEWIWKPAGLEKYENEFDTLGNLIRAIRCDWSSGNWRILQQQEYVYDQEGRLTLYILSKLSGTLKEYLRTEREYDAGGHLVRETSTGFMDRREGFAILGKHIVIRSFDPSGDISNEVWFYWDNESQAYLPEGKDFYFYHSSSSMVPHSRPAAVYLYPNPVHQQLYIRGLDRPATIRIFSTQGNLVFLEENVTAAVDLDYLASGTYVLEIIRQGSATERKLIVKE